MLRYVLRVRDLVHGTILFTETERKIIDHPLFQRLRQVRQNDVAFYVYPSLNTSRFEHVLGTCRVAGMMAENLTKSPKWRVYFRALKAETGISSAEQFIELSRLYALLHDIGHLPLSHLFEMAVEEYERSRKPDIKAEEVVQGWTGVTGFEELHEAFGALIVGKVIQDVDLSEPMKNALTTLMTKKVLPLSDPLSIMKTLVASDIDADRVDSVARDGRAAGGEYGNYDIRRLCDSVFIEEHKRGWLVAYSEKALTSMEALLLDRYRTHIWIHFHHRVVASKLLVRLLLQKAFARGIITKEHFDPANAEALAFRDDVWIWDILREMDVQGDDVLQMVKRAVFYREKGNVLNLWKNRPVYHELRGRVRATAFVDDFNYEPVDPYMEYLNKEMGACALMFEVEFKTTSKEAIPLYTEAEEKLTGRNLLRVSKLIENLEAIAKNEPQEFILLVGADAKQNAEQLQRRWVELTAQWVRK